VKTSMLRALAATVFVTTAAFPAAPAAGAAPPNFPDLDAFHAVDATAYSRPFSYAERWANVYSFFTTPDGLSCAVGPGSWCTGNLPGVDGATAGPCGSVHQAGDGQPFEFSVGHERCTAEDHLLQPGQKLTDVLTGTTCVVGENRLTACIEGNHGFVLQPSGSWTF
jgi:hypothetical protein